MMGDGRLTEGSIYDIKFAYNSRPVGYTTSMSHMNELCEMLGRLNINITKFSNNPKNFDFTNAIKSGL